MLCPRSFKRCSLSFSLSLENPLVTASIYQKLLVFSSGSIEIRQLRNVIRTLSFDVADISNVRQVDRFAVLVTRKDKSPWLSVARGNDFLNRLSRRGKIF